MPIAARWRSLERLPPARGRDAMPGVYEIADREKKVIYIGQSALDVPNRLRQHLAGSGCVRLHGCYWRYRYSRVPRADEAELMAGYRNAHRTLPRCNSAETKERDPQRRYLERSSGK